MHPTLQPGDKIIVRGVSADRLQTGDLVLVQSRGVWLVHRLIECIRHGKDLLFITKGDHHPAQDAPWTAEQVRGVVVALQHGSRTRHLDSRRHKMLDRAVAHLSRGQAFLWEKIPGGFLRRIVVKCARSLLYTGAWLVRRLP